MIEIEAESASVAPRQPAALTVVGVEPAPPAVGLKPELIAKGKNIYYLYCETCHGVIDRPYPSLHPDLTKLPEAKHKLFNDIVLGGLLAKNGLANFSNSLSEEDVEAIHQYLIDEQKKDYGNIE